MELQGDGERKAPTPKSEEDALREREALLTVILDTAVDAIITIDERGMVESVNQAGCRLFGYASEELIGGNVKVLMPSPYSEEHDGYLANYLRTGEKKIIGVGREVVGRRRGGSTFPMHLAVSEVRLKDRRVFTGILRDISDLKLAQNELIQLNEELEDRVRLRTSELKAAQEELVRQEKLATLGQLAGSVAHEIRNPLGVVKNAAYFLESLAKGDNEDVVAAFEEINRALNSSNRIVGELLDYARDPKMDAKDMRLDDIADRALKNVQPPERIEVRRRGVASPTVRADPEQVERIVTNLLQNAIQAMPGEGVLGIQTAVEGSRVVLEVADTGAGVPPDQLDKIFEPLYSTKVKGIGLGLALSKRYAELNGGGLTVRSDAGRGAVFRLSLPIANPPSSDA